MEDNAEKFTQMEEFLSDVVWEMRDMNKWH